MKRIAIALVVTAFIAACSGGGGGSPGTMPAAQSTAPVTGSGSTSSTTGTAPVSVTVRIPGRGTNALGRTPQYISTNTASIQAVTTLGTTPTSACSGATCSITFQAPIGPTTSITINLLSITSQLLSTATGSFNVQAGYANAFTVTFVGVVSSIVLSASPSSVVSLVGPTAITVTMTTSDASGAEILGTNGYSDSLGDPLTLTINVSAYTIPLSKAIGHGAQSNARASSLARLRPLASGPSSTAGFAINPIAGYTTEGAVAPTFTVTYDGTTRLQNSGGYNIQANAQLTSNGYPDPDTLTNNPVLVSATLEGLTLSDALGTLNTLTTLSPPSPLNPLLPSFYPDPSANSPTISTLEILAPPTQAPLAISLYLTEQNSVPVRTITTVNPVSQPTCPPALFASAPVVIGSSPPTWNFSINQVASQSTCWIGVGDGGTNEADLSIAVNGVNLTIQGAKRQQGARGK